MPKPETFIRSARRKLGWSQVRLAGVLGKSRRAIQNYEAHPELYPLPPDTEMALKYLLHELETSPA